MLSQRQEFVNEDGHPAKVWSAGRGEDAGDSSSIGTFTKVTVWPCGLPPSQEMCRCVEFWGQGCEGLGPPGEFFRPSLESHHETLAELIRSSTLGSWFMSSGWEPEDSFTVPPSKEESYRKAVTSNNAHVGIADNNNGSNHNEYCHWVRALGRRDTRTSWVQS